ncbi:MAG: hypothetical protein LLG14_13330 [Nocardiaceae bacterium]|nr:hypothetical protein [Nocardiaceae bacterium]
MNMPSGSQTRPSKAGATVEPGAADRLKLRSVDSMRLRELCAALIVGAVVGILAGFVVGVAAPGRPGASGVIATAALTDRGLPTESPAATDTQRTYASSQVVLLNSASFHQEVQKAFPNQDISISAALESQTAYIDITATAGDSDTAVKVVQKVVELYAKDKLDREAVQKNNALAAIDQLIGVASQNPAGGTQLARLQELRVDTELQYSAGNSTQVIVEPAAISAGLSAIVLKGILGGLAGVLVVAGGLLIWPRVTGRVTRTMAIGGIDGKVAYPEIVLPADGAQALAAVDQKTIGRLLLTQLPGRPAEGDHHVAVVGSGVGSSADVAMLLEKAASERGSGGPQTVILDCGTPADTPSLSDVIRNADDVVLVVRPNRDKIAVVDVVVGTCKSAGVPITVAVASHSGRQ